MRRLIPTVLALAILSGCAYQRVNETFAGNELKSEAATTEIQLARADRTRTVRVMEKPWVSQKPIVLQREDVLPDALRCNITFAPVQPLSVFEFGQMVTSLCGVPVRISPDAIAMLSGNQGGNGSAMQMPAAALPPIPMGAPGGAIPGGASLPPIPTAMNNAADYSRMGLVSNIKWQAKPLSGLLDVVSSRLGLSWKYEHNAISIFHIDTRVFRLEAIPSATTMRSTIVSGSDMAKSGGGGTEGGGGGVEITGGSNQTTEVAIQSFIAKDIKKTLDSMLTPRIGRASLSESTGTITVTDTPEVLARIDTYLTAENKSLKRQVRINVDMLVVTLDSSDRLGINWDVVYQQVSGKFGASLASNVAQTANAVAGSIGILDASQSPFSGTRLLAEALSTQGSVSTVTTPTIMTSNLQPAPLQIANQQGYLKSSTTTQTANVGVSSGLEGGTVTTGFNMNMFPYILDAQNLILQFSASISPKANLRVASNGTTSIEVPEMNSRTFSQQVRMKSGQTFVLSGFEQVTDSGDKSGVGEPGFFALGGGMGRAGKREVVVILITPVIQE